MPGKDRDPPGRGHEVLAVGDQHAPFGRRRLRAEAEIAEARAEQDGQRHVGHPVDDGRRDRVGQQVAEDDARVAIAHDAGGVGIVEPLLHLDLGRDQPGIEHPADDADGDVHVAEAGAEHRRRWR